MRALEAFLFNPIVPRPYAILRIATGFLAMAWLLSAFPHVELLYTDGGLAPVEALSGDQHFSLLFWIRSVPAVWTFYGVTLALCVLFILGVHSRITSVLLWICFVSFRNRATVLLLDGAQLYIGFLLFALMFAPVGRQWSVDASRHDMPQSAWPLGLRLLQFQLCMIYFYSGYWKMLGHEWGSGRAVELVLRNPMWRHFDMDGWLATGWFPLIPKIMTYTTLACELLFPLLILWRPTRLFAFVYFAGMHLSQWVMIETGLLPPVMLTFLLVLLDAPRADGPPRPHPLKPVVPLLVALHISALMVSYLPSWQHFSRPPSPVPLALPLQSALSDMKQSILAWPHGQVCMQYTVLIGFEAQFSTFAPDPAPFAEYRSIIAVKDGRETVLFSAVPDNPNGTRRAWLDGGFWDPGYSLVFRYYQRLYEQRYGGPPDVLIVRRTMFDGSTRKDFDVTSSVR